MRILAYAKLNLSLLVLGRRPDGYHEIDSVVQTVDLADEMDVELRESGVLVENDLPGLAGQDLAERAALDLLQAKDAGVGVVIRIRKSIPAGAGLGGGSSDAASVLRVLDRMIGPPLPPEVLRRIGGSIGSDVPLFLEGGRLRMTGRGEEIARLEPGEERAFVIVVPPVHCSTSDVYGRWRLSESPAASPPEVRMASLGRNDLMAPALALAPGLARYRDAVARIGGAYSGMSGSGSAFYAAFEDPDCARAAVISLENLLPEARVIRCRPVDEGSSIG